jgi:hypothetical protein
MTATSWHAFYTGDLQSLYALLVAPIAFLAYRCVVPAQEARAVVPEKTRFVSGITLLFAFETMLDPISTGPLLRSDWLVGSFAETAVPFLFVLLGDLRVLWLVFGVAQPEPSASAGLTRALAVSLIVPIATGLVYGVARALDPALPGQVLWMLYELFFLLLCIFLGRFWLPQQLQGQLGQASERASYLRAVLGFSAAYYVLWLLADLLIVVGGLDLGWAIRIVPNQLYYALWVPFVYARFFCARPLKAS